MGDDRTRFFARMESERLLRQPQDDDLTDMDINIGVTESGRTVILEDGDDDNCGGGGGGGGGDDDGLGDMDFESTRSSGAAASASFSASAFGGLGDSTTTSMILGNTERSLLNKFELDDNDNDRDGGGDGGPPFTNTERTMDTIATIDTVGTIESTRLDEIKDRAFRKDSEDVIVGGTHGGGDEDDDDDEGAKISAPPSAARFQPLQPLPQKLPPQILRIQEAALMTHQQQHQQQQQQQQQQPSQNLKQPPPSSFNTDDVNGFLDHNFNPAAATAVQPPQSQNGGRVMTRRQQRQRQDQHRQHQQQKQQSPQASQPHPSQPAQSQLSRTPPSDVATPYEKAHFGKRARSESVSERVLNTAELEGKGVINRDQKGILKDLIISGQDNDLQKALDRYDQGDASMLEGMLQSGTLPNTATEEVDLLGSLDFDFLNVKGQQGNNSETGVHLPPGHPLYNQHQQMASDGIGDLAFDGGQAGWGGYGGGNNDQSRSRSNSTWSEALELMQKHQQQRSRSNTAASMDLVSTRERSNSLFSPLIGNQPNDIHQTNYGRWMDQNQFAMQQQLLLQQQMMQQQAQLQQQEQLERQAQMEEYDDDDDVEDAEDDVEEEDESDDEEDDLDERLRQAISGAESRRSKAQKAQQQKKREQAKKRKEQEKKKKEKKEKAKKEKAKLAKEKKKKKEEEMEAEAEEEHVPGRPYSPSDINFFTTTIDKMGLRHVDRPEGWVGTYSPNSRKIRIERFLEKRNHRTWTKAIKYDVRKNFANTRLRVKGRFVKKEDELLMRELMGIT